MVNDIADKSFWDRVPFLKPYALLARWDRPIGFWLLFWPCVWGMALAPHFKSFGVQGQVEFVVLFFIGAVAMRGAGCTLNDLIDRKLDAQVERTKTRPLPSGAVKPWQALAFLILQLIAGAVILFQFPSMAIILGLCTLPLIAIYPLMKRFVWYPQFFLSVNFAAGAIIGWAAVENTVSLPAFILYAAGICWVIAYDTVYAHMDTKDDVLIGIKSTALWWGFYSKLITGCLWIVTLLLFGVALFLVQAPVLSYVMLVFAGFILLTAHIYWKPDNAAYSLNFFRLQQRVGMVLALSALAPVFFPN
jgi:4-hydroxybenzoate polyprenyltransferase